jgi:hypothetical protein
VDFKQKCNELRHSHFLPQPKLLLEQIPHIAGPLQRLEDETSPIIQRELSRILDKVNFNSANGTDGISYKVLRTFHEASPSILPHLFNAMFSHSIHSQEWKHAVCVVIPKKESHLIKTHRHTDRSPYYHASGKSWKLFCQRGYIMRPAEQAQYQKTKWEVYSTTLPLCH